MSIQFLRGDPQAPKGHAIFIARSTANPRTVLATYCIVPPMPLSLAKYLPSFLASQLPPEDLQDATNVPVMPLSCLSRQCWKKEAHWSVYKC